MGIFDAEICEDSKTINVCISQGRDRNGQIGPVRKVSLRIAAVSDGCETWSNLKAGTSR